MRGKALTTTFVLKEISGQMVFCLCRPFLHKREDFFFLGTFFFEGEERKFVVVVAELFIVIGSIQFEACCCRGCEGVATTTTTAQMHQKP